MAVQVVRRLGLVTLVTLAAAGCSETSNDATPVPSQRTAGSSTALQNPADAAKTAATAKASEFYSVVAKVIAGTLPVDALSGVAAGAVQTAYVSEVAKTRAEGNRTEGEPRIVRSKIVSTDLPLDESGKPKQAPGTVRVETCLDVRPWKVFGPNGKPAVTRPERGALQIFEVSNPSWAASQGWRVTRLTQPPDPACL